ncbi:MAG: hypothetical protein Q7K21_03325 [Elusimicrobiota bacterium]|nr:hypothetical protein [Elusimicrobiota bacterium]
MIKKMRLTNIGLVLVCLMTLNVSLARADGLIVYGDTWAMMIVEPQGWVGDTESGANDGMNVVLYPKGSIWGDASIVIYGIVLDIKTTDIKWRRSEDRRLNAEHYGKKFHWQDIEINRPNKAGYVFAGAEMYAESYEKMVWIGDKKNNIVVLFVLNSHNGKKPQKSKIDLFDKFIQNVTLMQKK